MAIILFVIVFMILDYSCNNLTIKKWLDKRLEQFLFNSILLVSFAYLLRAYEKEIECFSPFATTYLRHMIPRVLYISVLICCTILFKLIISEKLSLGRKVRIIFSIIVGIIQMMFLYCPNPFEDNFGGIWHLDAYTNSIINTLNYAPHELYSASIYGHYGLFFILPCKILQILGVNQWRALSVTICFFGGMAFFLTYWIFHKMLKNDAVYVLAILAYAVVSVQIFWNQYFQMIPHRYLFQAITIAFFYKTYDEQDVRKRKMYRRCGWILVALGILWNFETGMVCAIVWMLKSLYIDLHCEKQKNFLYLIAKNICFLLISFSSAYGVVNVYNVLVGGNIISPLTYIYPLGSKTYVIEALQTPLQSPWGSLYFIVVTALLVTLVVLLKKYVLGILNKRELTLFLVAVMGCGVYTYYMNRAVEMTNASIVVFPFVLIVSVLCDNIFGENVIESSVQILARSGAIISLIILTSMALATVSTFGKTLATKLITTYDETSIREVSEEMKNRLPQGTVAFGLGTAQLFAYADMKTGIYITDWADLADSLGGDTIINPDALEKLKEMISQNDYKYILVNQANSNYLYGHYKEIDRIDMKKDICYILYERIEGEKNQ